MNKRKPALTLQLYTLRKQLEMDYEGTIRTLAQIGFSCVEPAGYPNSSPTEAARIFQQYGLTAPSAHMNLPVGEHAQEIIETALELGHKYLITAVPPYGIQNFCHLDGIKAAAELYCEASANAAAHDIMIGYHNHAKDLALIDGRPAYQYFLEFTPDTVLWEADLFWLAKAGLDPAMFLQEIGLRGRILHFKDGLIAETNTMFHSMPAGQGDIDLVAAAKAANHAEYIGVELDDYAGNIWEAIQSSYDYLTQQNIAYGNK